jgi:5'(3')-deoxyribonucleotidase
MKIGIDMDGVLAKFESGYAPLLTARTGIEFPLDDPDFPPQWHWPNHYNVSKDAQDEAWREIKQSPDFWYGLGEMPLARETVRRLNVLAIDHDIYFITHRMGWQCKQQTEEWLKSRGMGNPTVMLAHDKHLIAVGLQLDVFIDDRPSNVNEVAILARDCEVSMRVYLVDRPYNRESKIDRSVVRVHSLADALTREFPMVEVANDVVRV